VATSPDFRKNRIQTEKIVISLQGQAIRSSVMNLPQIKDNLILIPMAIFQIAMFPVADKEASLLTRRAGAIVPE